MKTVKNLIVFSFLFIATMACNWNDVKSQMAERFAHVTHPGVSALFGCNIPNDVVRPWLADYYKKKLKVNKKLKSQAKMFDSKNKSLEAGLLGSEGQKAFIQTVCKAGVKWIEKGLLNKFKGKLPQKLKDVGCSTEYTIQNGAAAASAICDLVPLR